MKKLTSEYLRKIILEELSVINERREVEDIMKRVLSEDSFDKEVKNYKKNIENDEKHIEDLKKDIEFNKQQIKKAKKRKKAKLDEMPAMAAIRIASAGKALSNLFNEEDNNEGHYNETLSDVDEAHCSEGPDEAHCNEEGALEEVLATTSADDDAYQTAVAQQQGADNRSPAMNIGENEERLSRGSLYRRRYYGRY